MKKWEILLLCMVPLGLCSHKTMAQAPSWHVDAEGFQYNMSVTARIYLDLTAVDSGSNVLGAFVGEEVRGVAYPQSVDGIHYYFLTIYSNSTSGDSIQFKAYLESTDSIYDALEVLEFQKDAMVGMAPNPYHVNVSLLGDFPIQLLPVPVDTTLDGIPFDSLTLTDYLVSYDNDPIDWSALPGPNLSVGISPEQKLLVDQVMPGWTGTDSILIIATEMGTASAFKDSVVAWYTVEPNYLGPDFTFIPAQYALDSLFPEEDVNDHVLYEGDCLQYQAELLRPEDTLSDPGWVPPVPGAGAMNLILKLNFNGLGLNAPGTMAGFVDAQLAGVATPVPVGNAVYYFLTLANVATGSIDFKFYDSNKKHLHNKRSGLPFVPGGSAGLIADPIILEMAPLVVNINAQGVWSAAVVDTTFTGHMIVEFRTRDCDHPSKNDTIRVPFVSNQCANQLWEICPGGGLCVSADTGLVTTIWFKNGHPVFDQKVLSIFQPGVYHYQGVTAGGDLALSCPLDVQEDQGCIGVFPSHAFPVLDLEFLAPNNPVVFTETSIEVDDFDVRWNGSGDNISWHDPANWEFGLVPSRCQHVILPLNAQVHLQPGQAASIWRLTLESGAMLNVHDPSGLNILGN